MKKWSRVLALLLAAALALGLTACNSNAEVRQSEQPSYEDEEDRGSKKTSREDEDEDENEQDQQESLAKSLYERGMEMVDLIQQMANSKEFLAFKFGLDREKLDELDDAPEGEPITALASMKKSNLECVYEIKMSLGPYWEFVESYLKEQGLNVDNIPPEIQERLPYGMCNSLVSSMSSSWSLQTMIEVRGYSVTYMSALWNNFQISDAFVSDEVETDVAYIYMFEDVAVLVTFTKNAGGTVSASATPVFADKIVGASHSEIRESLENMMNVYFGFDMEVEVTDVTP